MSGIDQGLVIDQIRDDIVFGVLRPKERLVEEELAVHYGCGRYTIRAALDELENMGLVTRRKNKGASVRNYTREEVDELYEMRSILQREAALRVPLEKADQIAEELEAIQERYSASLKSGNLRQVAVENESFHSTLYGYCGNRFLIESIQIYWYKTMSIHSYAIGRRDMAKRSNQEHYEMIKYLRERNRERLAKICVDHIYTALKAYEEASSLRHGRE